ncbi:MAG: DUF3108 domain-containing protein [Mariprofundaceae bacterium]
MNIYLRLASVTALILAPTFAYAAQPKLPKCLPFHGETMKFSIGWEFINAGTATMHFSNHGKAGYHVDTDARTNKFFDMFKKVRDSIISEGLCINSKPQSTLFNLNQHENKYRAKKRTDYLWKKNKVNYAQNGKTDSYDVPAGYLNVLDAFFLFRTLPVKEKDILKIPVFDSRKLYEIEVRLLKKEHLKAPWGELVECLVIEPKLKTAGIFSSKGTMKVWLTNDNRRIPLKMTAKIKIGRIIARLTGYAPPS